MDLGKPILVTVIAAVLQLAPACAKDVDRYVAPNGAFSIASRGPDNFMFHAAPPVIDGDITVVDFPFLNSVNLPMVSRCTVEWIRLDKPIDPAAFDAQATGLTQGYIEARFGADRFPIADRGKFRDATGRAIYVFAAHGELLHMPAQWQGVVLFFDTGVALVSAVVAQPTSYRFEPKDGVQDAAIVNWALTLRPGHD